MGGMDAVDGDGAEVRIDRHLGHLRGIAVDGVRHALTVFVQRQRRRIVGFDRLKRVAFGWLQWHPMGHALGRHGQAIVKADYSILTIR